jgi:hypothetical protein
MSVVSIETVKRLINRRRRINVECGAESVKVYAVEEAAES